MTRLARVTLRASIDSATSGRPLAAAMRIAAKAERCADCEHNPLHNPHTCEDCIPRLCRTADRTRHPGHGWTCDACSLPVCSICMEHDADCSCNECPDCGGLEEHLDACPVINEGRDAHFYSDKSLGGAPW